MADRMELAALISPRITLVRGVNALELGAWQCFAAILSR